MCDGQHRKKLIYYITPATGNFRLFIFLTTEKSNWQLKNFSRGLFFFCQIFFWFCLFLAKNVKFASITSRIHSRNT